MTLGKMTGVNTVMNPQHFGSDWQTSGSDSRLIWKSGFKFWITFGGG